MYLIVRQSYQNGKDLFTMTMAVAAAVLVVVVVDWLDGMRRGRIGR